MTNTTVKIVSLVVGKDKVTLYHPDGTTTVYDQGDTRVQSILDQALPIIAKRDGSIAEVTIPGMGDDSDLYEGVQKKTGGLFRLFKVAIHHVAHIFEEKKPEKVLTPEEEQAAHDEAQRLVAQLMAQGQSAQEAETNVAASRASEAQRVTDAVAETKATERREYTGSLGGGIIPGIPDSELKPASKPGKDETIVAVTASGRVIPHMEKLRSQFAHILSHGGEKGLIAFLSRLEAVIDKRGHSVEDVLRFMERGDLPLAEDGTIIAYKLLTTENRRCLPEFRNSRPGLLFDVHSGKIPQGVGSYVKVDESLVDPNRRNECSNGLHIARRGYLSSFGGDTCVLIKLAPEDVIAVPSYDANKVRVCGYHILFALNPDEFRKVKADKAMTDAEDSQTLLGRAIRGDHTPVIERVEVHGQNGNNVKIVRLLQGSDYEQAVKTALDRSTLSSTLVRALAVEQLPEGNERIMSDAAKVSPKDLAAKLSNSKPLQTKTTQPKASARVIEATRLLDIVQNTRASLADRQEAAKKLKAFKSKAKVGWVSLGCPPDMTAELDKVLKQEPPVPVAKPATKKVSPAKSKAVKPKTDTGTKTSAPKASVKTVAKKPDPVLSESRGDKAARLNRVMNDAGLKLADRQHAARELLALKRSAKVSWLALGLTGNIPDRIEQVINMTNPSKPKPVAKEKAKPSTAAKPATVKSETAEETILKQVKAGSLSKAEAARKLNTSPRSIDRKLAKFS